MNELTANTRTLEIFPWNENFCTGIEETTIQHKRLVELLNVLVSHLAFNADTPTLNNVFDELKNYTVVHFSTEERIWRAFQAGPVGGVAPRRTATSSPRSWEIKQQESEMPMDDVIVEIVRFPTHWLALHIIESDKRMAKGRPGPAQRHLAASVPRIRPTREMARFHPRPDQYRDGHVRQAGQPHGRADTRDQPAHQGGGRTRRIQDQLLRLTNAAVHESQTKSTFLASMSHEIPHADGGRISMVDVLLNTPLSDEQRKMVDVIRDSAHAQLAILNDILDSPRSRPTSLDLLEPFRSPR